jgi:hypothetical protein
VKGRPAEELGSATASRPSLWRWAPLALALAVLAYHVAPLWGRYESSPFGDGGYLWFVFNVDRASIVEHHQLPLWNPYYCGGAPHLASPQSGSLSPFSLLPLAFGTPIGNRLGYTLGLLAALLSLRAYARVLGLSEVGATVAGAGYALCGAFTQHMSGGHWVWIPFAFYPLMLRSLHLALAGRREHVVWGALPLAFTIYHWPIYPMFYAMMLLPIFAVFIGLDDGRRDLRRVARAVGLALAIVAVAIGLGLLRLVPVIEHTAAHPRVVNDRDYTWPWELFEMYGLRHRAWVVPGHQYVWPEYGNYLGLVGLALMLVGAYVVARRRRVLLPIVAGVVTFLVFQLGNLVPLPWWLLRHLPVFNHLRVPSRFTVIAGMFMCVLIGVAVDELAAPALADWRGVSPRARGVGLLATLLAVAFVVDAAQFNRQLWEKTFSGPPRSLPRAAEFHQAPGNAGLMYLYPPANQGSLSCFEETPIPISPALRPNLPADEYLRDPTAGTVRRVRWSPNRIDLDVDLLRPGRVIVNQNHGSGWRVSGGTILSDQGLLAADVPAGRHAVTFSYLPTSVVVGGILTALTALGAATFLLLERRRRAAADVSRAAPAP